MDVEKNTYKKDVEKNTKKMEKNTYKKDEHPQDGREKNTKKTEKNTDRKDDQEDGEEHRKDEHLQDGREKNTYKTDVQKNTDKKNVENKVEVGNKTYKDEPVSPRRWHHSHGEETYQENINK